jgi:hypothetical protein
MSAASKLRFIAYEGPSQTPSQAPRVAAATPAAAMPARHISVDWPDGPEPESTSSNSEEESASEESCIQDSPTTRPKAKAKGKAPATTTPKKKKQQKRVCLTEEDHLIILRLCNRAADAWRTQDKTKFWKYIKEDFKKETGKVHTNLRRVVQSRIALRRNYLAGLGSGEADNESERSIQEDAWIEVLDEEDRLIKDRKARSARVTGESSASYLAREAMMMSQSEKRRLDATTIRPRSRQPAKVAKIVSGFATDDEDEAIAISNSLEDVDTVTGNSIDNSINVYSDNTPEPPSQPPSRPASRPPNRASSSRPSSASRGRTKSRSTTRKRRRSSSSSVSNSSDRLAASIQQMATAIASRLSRLDSVQPATAWEARIQAVDEQIGSLKEGQQDIMRLLKETLEQQKKGAQKEIGSNLPIV